MTLEKEMVLLKFLHCVGPVAVVKYLYLKSCMIRLTTGKLQDHFLFVWVSQSSTNHSDYIPDFLMYNVQCSLFIQQPQHHPSTPPFALHPVLNTITLNASASVNTHRLSGIKKIARQGKEKKEWGRAKRSGAEKRLGSGEVQLSKASSVLGRQPGQGDNAALCGSEGL